MTQDELDEHLRPAMEKAVADAFAKNLYVSYHDERCPSPAHFIHEYKDGKQFLILQDEYKMKYTVVRQLN